MQCSLYAFHVPQSDRLRADVTDRKQHDPVSDACNDQSMIPVSLNVTVARRRLDVKPANRSAERLPILWPCC